MPRVEKDKAVTKEAVSKFEVRIPHNFMYVECQRR